MNTFLKYLPPDPLNQYINHYWFHKGTVNYQEENILPSPSVELIINLGKPTILVNSDKSKTLLNNAWICGLFTDPMTVHRKDQNHLLGISFKPFGFKPFFPGPMADFTNSHVDLARVLGTENNRFLDAIQCATKPEDQFLIIDQFLKSRFDPRVTNLELMRSLVTQSFDHFQDGLSWIDQVSGFSRKHLINLYQNFVGLSPAVWNRILRFNYALKLIDTHLGVNWIDLAFKSGYYDQAHFIHEFQTFTGVSPNQYVKQRLKHFDYEPLAGEDIQFLPFD